MERILIQDFRYLSHMEKYSKGRIVGSYLEIPFFALQVIVPVWSQAETGIIHSAEGVLEFIELNLTSGKR